MQCPECQWTHDHVHSDTRPERLPWDETPDGDQDDTIEFDADLAFELLEDR